MSGGRLGPERRAALLYLLPTLLLIALQVLPLVAGRRTLYLRDVLNAHLPMKAAQAEAMRAGELPLVDALRAGGQPLIGNPNAAALYPDNLLFLLAPLHWAHNARFWIHWLIAPFAMFVLAREWGLAARGAAMAAAAFALCGYFISQLNFYNTVAGVALAPLFVALFLRGAGWTGGRRGPLLAAVAGTWGLLLLSGEPFVALMALVLALAAALLRTGRGFRAQAPRLALAGLAGTALAAPQLVELGRILPLSYRGYRGYSAFAGTTASFDPRQAVEWLLPFLFGRPDRPRLGGFWGEEFFTGAPALFYTLYPGLLVLALLAAAGRPRRADPARLWAWGAAAGGVFLALGRFNPLVAWLYGTSWGGAMRYPIRFWLPVALGLALLAGLGFERAAQAEAHGRRVRNALLALAAVYAVTWLVLSLRGDLVEAWMRTLMPSLPAEFALNERLRWAGLCLFSLAILGVLLVVWRWARRARFSPAATATLLAFHVATQLLLLRPALVTDDVAPYLEPSPLLAWIPPTAATVHGHANARDLFGKVAHPSLRYPDERALWIERRVHQSLYPLAGALFGRRFELNVSPEDLDSYLTLLAVGVTQDRSDTQRLRLLRSWGVDRLLLERELDAEARASGQARLLHRQEFFGVPTFVYALEASAPRVARLGRIERAPHINAAVGRLADPSFDPRTTVVLAGGGADQAGAVGEVEVRQDGREAATIVTDGATPGVVVVQRAYLSLWRATVDGEPATIQVANLHRMAVEVPAGRHEVRLWIDRRPTRAAFGVAALALVAIVLAAWRWR